MADSVNQNISFNQSFYFNEEEELLAEEDSGEFEIKE
jgi:hypothetical protein